MAFRRDGLSDDPRPGRPASITADQVEDAFELTPHRAESVKLSADPLIVDKFFDVVGRYPNPTPLHVRQIMTIKHIEDRPKLPHKITGH